MMKHEFEMQSQGQRRNLIGTTTFSARIMSHDVEPQLGPNLEPRMQQMLDLITFD